MFKAISRVRRPPGVARLGGLRSSIRRLASASGSLDASKRPPHPNEAFLQGASANYMDAMYAQWSKDPSSVHVSWQVYFGNVNAGEGPATAFTPPPSLLSNVARPQSTQQPSGGQPKARLDGLVSEGDIRNIVTGEVSDHMKIQLLQRAYQVRGHHMAHLDPLGINEPDLSTNVPPELEPKFYGFTEADLDRSFTLGPGVLPRFLRAGITSVTLRELVAMFKEIYCGSIGVEYGHIPSREQCDWIRERVEIPNRYRFTAEQKWAMLDRLIWSDTFERFLATKYPGEKRFGLEGGEALIPGMKALIDRSVENGVGSIVMGMPHRGRLNVLSNVVRMPHESLFHLFMGAEPGEEGAGDVKYHLGLTYDRPTPSGKMVRLFLDANPSHLEAVDPVVLGHARALQDRVDGEGNSKVMPLLLHGDAAFAAQGVVYETLGLSELPAYTTGGTIHLIVNNQIGFTTDPRYSRSTPYCSDVAKTVGAPIFHVNADDLEAVVFVSLLAADWRSTFKKDVVIDLVCYRRYGHNEVDQPAFTQPRMYDVIKNKERVLDVYTKKLISEGTFSEQAISENKKRVLDIMTRSHELSKQPQPPPQQWTSSSWDGFRSPQELAKEITPIYDTGDQIDTLRHIGKTTSSYPEGFNTHPLLARILKGRQKTIDEGKNIDMPTAEALGFGSLLLEGYHVRLSGQDVQRGTFSQRHAVFHDQKTEEQYTPLCHLSADQGQFTVRNSSLSEYGILGFEVGYSQVDPNHLVIWEAQFGDFANNAQCIIDQFVASMEEKWVARSGIVLSLPHGYDGQGPEHSSARMERFLQLCDDHPYKFPPEMSVAMQRQHQDCNMQVVYPTTPANYFHVLRRQLKREFRKPLILHFSKSLLRHPLARSSIDQMGPDTKFNRFIPEVLHEHDYAPNLVEANKLELASPEDIKTLIFCSGQVYYNLFKAREANEVTDVAIGRLEQLNPFPYDKVCEFLEKYPNAERIVWAQEEPLNNGAYTFASPRLTTAILNTQAHKQRSTKRMKEIVDNKGSLINIGANMVEYAGRDPSSSVATGNKKRHMQEEDDFLSQALFGEVRPIKR